MSIFRMSNYMTLWDGISGAGVVNFGPVVATTQGETLLTTGTPPVLGYYDGNALAFFRYLFDPETNIILNRLKISIPQYRGITYSYDPTISIFNKFELELVSNITATAESLYFNVGAFGEWADVDYLLDTPDSGEKYYLRVPAQQISCDFRNVQTIYDGISPKLLIEADITSPITPTDS